MQLYLYVQLLWEQKIESYGIFRHIIKLCLKYCYEFYTLLQS